MRENLRENSPESLPEGSALLGAPFFARTIATRHEGVTLLLLDVAPTTTRPADILACLSIEEQARAARYRSLEDRLRSGLTRAALRRVLGAATGRAPEALVFTTEFRGKPRLVDPNGPHFNVSHSGSLALIGVSHLRPIGVDIEWMRDLSDALGMAEAFFSPREYRSLAGLHPNELTTAFYKIWTGKEAVVKAFGTGVGEGLRNFTVAPSGPRLILVPETRPSVARLADTVLESVAVPELYTAAFALA
jgi:4'-phosphopantetheinyl transferase